MAVAMERKHDYVVQLLKAHGAV